MLFKPLWFKKERDYELVVSSGSTTKNKENLNEKKPNIGSKYQIFRDNNIFLRFRDASLHGPFKVHHLKKNNGLKGTNMSLKGCTDSVNSPTTNIIYQAKTSWSIFSQVMQNVAVPNLNIFILCFLICLLHFSLEANIALLTLTHTFDNFSYFADS